jgi:NADH:ubiquinone oxidoreductase subunit 6 (subunit J)
MKNRIFLIIIAFILLVAGSSTGAFAQGDTTSNTGTGMVDIGLYIALIKTGLGVVAILVVFAIAYVLSGNEVTEQYRQFNVGPGGSKLIGGGIITVYLLFFIALAAIVYTEVTSIVK